MIYLALFLMFVAGIIIGLLFRCVIEWPRSAKFNVDMSSIAKVAYEIHREEVRRRGGAVLPSWDDAPPATRCNAIDLAYYTMNNRETLANGLMLPAEEYIYLTVVSLFLDNHTLIAE